MWIVLVGLRDLLELALLQLVILMEQEFIPFQLPLQDQDLAVPMLMDNPWPALHRLAAW